MNSQTSSRFWECYERLPERIRLLADKSFALWKVNSLHPSLQFKEVGARLWSARIGLDYRALAVFDGTTCIWFWIGSHDEYIHLIRSL